MSQKKVSISVRSVATCFRLERILRSVSFPFRSRFKRKETDVPFLSLPLCKQARDVGLYLADSVLPYSEEIATRATCISRKKRSSLQLTH